jgi:DNA-binding transcriptional MerR regulator
MIVNDLVGIQTLSRALGVSTRTLRHYEDVGLLSSVRLPDRQQRYYSDDAIRRVNQIRILRKMEIPIKDILKIYQSAETMDIIEVFSQKISSIDENIATLTELRSLVEDFRQELLARGIASVSDLPALLESKPAILHNSNHMERLEAVSKKRANPHWLAISIKERREVFISIRALDSLRRRMYSPIVWPVTL